MPDKTILIPRDLPLEPGRALRFTFTISYEVTLDENVLDYIAPEGPFASDDLPEERVRLQPATLDEIEQYLTSGRLGATSEQLWKTLHENYDRDVVEHEVTLADSDESYDSPLQGARFEMRWERRDGTQAPWLTRTWLTEIPPVVPRSYPTAEEVMDRDG